MFKLDENFTMPTHDKRNEVISLPESPITKKHQIENDSAKEAYKSFSIKKANRESYSIDRLKDSTMKAGSGFKRRDSTELGIKTEKNDFSSAVSGFDEHKSTLKLT